MEIQLYGTEENKEYHKKIEDTAFDCIRKFCRATEHRWLPEACL